MTVFSRLLSFVVKGVSWGAVKPTSVVSTQPHPSAGHFDPKLGVRQALQLVKNGGSVRVASEKKPPSSNPPGVLGGGPYRGVIETRKSGMEGPSFNQLVLDDFQCFRSGSEIDVPDLFKFQGNPGTLRRLIEYGQNRGVRIDDENRFVRLPRAAVEYIQAVLAILPDSLIASGYLQTIFFHEGGSEFSRGINPTEAPGQIWISSSSFAKFSFSEGLERMNLLGDLLGPICTSVAWHHRDHKSMRNAFKVLQGDITMAADGRVLGRRTGLIPDTYRQGMYHYSGPIERFLYSLDDKSLKDYLEFVVETAFIYIVDGTGLRIHIDSLKANPETKAMGMVYDYVYEKLKKEVFGGREY